MDQSLPTQERVDAAVNRVQKHTITSKAVIASGGVKREGGDGRKENGKWKASKSLQQLQQQHLQARQLMLPPGFGSGFGQGRGNGALNIAPVLTCFNCGLPGHIAANCPKTKK